MSHRPHHDYVGVAVVTLSLVCVSSCTQSVQGGEREPAAREFRVEAVSAKPHLVSGGDVLLRVSLPDGTSPSALALSGGGGQLAVDIRPEPDGNAVLVLVSGLPDGDTTIHARLDRSDVTAAIDVTSYPIAGPMISGPHEQPYHCQTQDFELVTGEPLGPALDSACSVSTRVDYVYRATDGTFKPLATSAGGAWPDDVSSTTTLDGVTVPFTVRVETGTVNRAIYENAILHDPRDPEPNPWMRSRGWNGKLVYTHGGGCRNGWYRQGSATGGVLREGLLQDGFGVTSASLNVFGQNCNDLLASETHMMVKERFIERYGPVEYTIGTGGSGGSYQSHQTADNYPGVFDGIIVRSSFPDVLSATIFTLTDARLLHYYFTDVAPGVFTQEELRLVAGFGEWGSLPNLSRGAARVDPIFNEGDALEEQGGEVRVEVLETERYDPVSNPTGVRATVYEHMINVFGVDPETGFAARPLDNVGVQYGLAALNRGQITKSQFLDLNERIGGLDIDGNHVPARHVANEHAARVAVETGRILNGGGGLAVTPVIDYRTYTDDRERGDIHMIVHQYSTRARLLAAHGHADNQVMAVEGRWGFTDDEPDLRTLFRHMDAWLMAINEVPGDRPLAEQVVAAKPPALVDHCWDRRSESLIKIDETQTFDGGGLCNQLYPAFPTARHVAGASLVNNIVKCELKPIRLDDYAVTFTEDERAQLERIFVDGVCDWREPGPYAGVYQGTWLSFGPSPVNRVEPVPSLRASR